MKSSKIKQAAFSNRKRSISVAIGSATLELPFSKLEVSPNADNPAIGIKIDRDLGGRGVLCQLKDGKELAIPIEAFLEFNRDPEYMREIEIYKLTSRAIDLVKSSGMSKRAICRRMGTSLSQLSRLLDPTNYQKTIDQMLKLLTILGARIDIKVAI
jgi:hypothetical protein